MKINLPLYFIIISLFIGLFLYNYDNYKEGFNCGNSFTEFREMPENFFQWPGKLRDLTVLDGWCNQIAKLNEETSKSEAMDIYRDCAKVISDAKNTKGSCGTKLIDKMGDPKTCKFFTDGCKSALYIAMARSGDKPDYLAGI